MTAVTEAVSKPGAPARVSSTARLSAIKVEPLTCTIGAELSNVNLGDAARDADLMARDPRAAAEAQGAVLPRPGHHAAPSTSPSRATSASSRTTRSPAATRTIPGLVRIYKSPDTPNDRYENAWHTDATWREKPPFGCVLRCVECPRGRRRHDVGQHGRWPTSGCRSTSRRRSPACARATASRPPSARRCRSRSASR